MKLINTSRAKLFATENNFESKTWKDYNVERSTNSVKVGSLGTFSQTRWLNLLQNGLNWLQQVILQVDAEEAYENYMISTHPEESVDLRTNCYETHQNLQIWILVWATLTNLLEIVWQDAIDNLIVYEQLFVRLIEKLTLQDYHKALDQITLNQVGQIKHRLFYMYDFLPEDDALLQLDFLTLEAVITDVKMLLQMLRLFLKKSKITLRKEMLC